MNKNTIYVNLQFQADTKHAKQQIADLQSNLNRAIQTGMSNSSLSLTPQIQQATQHAQQLSIALNKATNVNTGKLNLNKFQAQLKQSNLNLKTLGNSLSALGPAGIQAFNQMTNAIVQADTRMFSLSASAKRLVTTFGNTLRYQASTAAITAMTSAISGAITYTKDLDKSLTNIRVVTGKSAVDMERL